MELDKVMTSARKGALDSDVKGSFNGWGYYGNSDVKVLNFGAKKEFTDRVPVADLYQRYHLTKELITEDVSKVLKRG